MDLCRSKEEQETVPSSFMVKIHSEMMQPRFYPSKYNSLIDSLLLAHQCFVVVIPAVVKQGL